VPGFANVQAAPPLGVEDLDAGVAVVVPYQIEANQDIRRPPPLGTCKESGELLRIQNALGKNLGVPTPLPQPFLDLPRLEHRNRLQPPDLAPVQLARLQAIHGSARPADQNCDDQEQDCEAEIGPLHCAPLRWWEPRHPRPRA